MPPLPPGVAERPAPSSTLVLAPHFDDEILGCGGLLAQLAAGGAAVRILYLTDGSGGAEELADRVAYAAERRREAAKALAVWGGSGFDVAEIPDGGIELHLEETVVAIRRALLAQRPERLLVPSPLEVTADHRATFAALHRLLAGVRPGDELEAVAGGLEILVYEVNHPGYPDLLVDVSAELGLLGEAMAAYASQQARHPYLEAALGLRGFRTHTLAPGIRGAEGYRRLRLADFTTRGPAALVEHLGGASRTVEVDDGPRVSIVVRTMNRPHLLAEALASLLRSTYRRFEIVLVNDGGVPPELPELPEGTAGIPIVRVDLTENRGRAAAANAGIAAASGDWVGFLDDDDRVEREHLATLVGLARAGGHRVVYSDAAVTLWEPDAAEGWRCVDRRLPYSRDFDPRRLLVDNYIPLHTLLIERALLAEVGDLDVALPYFEDWDLLLRLSFRASFLHLARVTCEYRHFRGSAHHALGEHARDRADFLARKAQVLAKHAGRLTPELLAGAVDDLRAESVSAGTALEQEQRERRREAAAFRRERGELGAEIDALRREIEKRDGDLRATYGEIERLNGLVREMEGTRAWRAHRWLESVRGR